MSSKSLVFWFVVFSHCTFLFSQPNLRFEEVNAVNSLSQNAVNCMYQDKLGFLWLGTYNGLNKYDGYKFKVYNFNQNPSDNTSSNRVSFIREDNYGKIWLGTYDGRVHRFDPYKEEFLSFPMENDPEQMAQITHYYETHDGIVCLSTDKTGIYLIRENLQTNEAEIQHITQKNGLSSDQVYFTHEDHQHNLWIGTAKGLNRMKIDNTPSEKPEIERFFSDNIHFTKSADLKSKVWFGTQNNGIYCYDLNRRRFTEFEGNQVHNSLKDDNITSLMAHDNHIWLGTSSGKIIQYSGDNQQFINYPIQNDKIGKDINKIYIDHFGQVWIITEAFGITRLNPDNHNFKHYTLTPDKLKNLTDDERTVLLEDNQYNLWLGVQNVGVLYYDRPNDSMYIYANDPQDPHSLSSNIVECIYEDRTGNLWIGTSWFGKGLNKMVSIDPAFKYLRPVDKPENKIQNVVRSIFVDSEGYTWIATKSGQVYIYDQNNHQVDVIQKSDHSGFTGHNVYTIYEDSKNHIWLGTKGGGAFRSTSPISQFSPRYSQLNFKSIKALEGPDELLNSNNIYDITEDQQGRIWIATYGGGLHMISSKGDSHYTVKHFSAQNSNLTNNKIRDLLIDRHGRLWIGTTYGLNFIDLQKKQDFTINSILSDPDNKNSLSYNDIMMMMEDSKGKIWLATAGGGTNIINYPNQNELIINHLTKQDGLKDNINTSLMEGPNGFIWIGTEHGISRYNPTNNEVINFDQKNGLPVLLCSENTIARTPSGNILIGTIDGLYNISPDAIKTKDSKPNICLTSLQVNNKEVNPHEKDSPLEQSISYTDHITLKRKQANFTLEFAMLSFKSPESNQFSVILEGFEEKWNYLGAEHKATYTNIPPGEYQFRVKNLNTNLAPNNPEKVLSIKVLPSFWESWQAFVLYALLIGIILTIVLKITYKMARLKNDLEVEHRVAESKLRFFTNVSHELRTPLTLILGPIESLISHSQLSAEVKQQLSIVQRNTRRLQRTVNQLLDFRKAENDKVQLKLQEIDLISLIQQIYYSYQELARHKNIQFDLVYDSQKIMIWGDIQKIDIVIFNLLSNAFKFTHENQNISVAIDEDDHHVYIIVRDTGQGIKPDKLPYIFDRFFVSHTESKIDVDGTGIGLSLSKKYVHLHHGEITAESIPNQETRFTVLFQKGSEHFQESDFVEFAQQPFDPPYMIHNELDLPIQPEASDQTVRGQENEKDDILIVEDNPDMASYVKNVLASNYNISIASDGLEGWKMAEKHLPDLIIADIMMPKMDGAELTKKLKEEFSTCHIPVIMLTAKSETEDLITGLEIGAEAYLSKPFQPEVLLTYVKTFITQREKVKSKFESTVELKPDEIQVTPQDKVFIEKIMKCIDENLADPEFSVDKLAKMMNVSRTIFYKKIKSITGYQPIELIRMLRMKKAAQLIETGEFNITEVAYNLGYNDVRYFSTSFKKQFGVSPSNYTKDQKKQES